MRHVGFKSKQGRYKHIGEEIDPFPDSWKPIYKLSTGKQTVPTSQLLVSSSIFDSLTWLRWSDDKDSLGFVLTSILWLFYALLHPHGWNLCVSLVHIHEQSVTVQSPGLILFWYTQMLSCREFNSIWRYLTPYVHGTNQVHVVVVRNLMNFETKHNLHAGSRSKQHCLSFDGILEIHLNMRWGLIILIYCLFMFSMLRI